MSIIDRLKKSQESEKENIEQESKELIGYQDVGAESFFGSTYAPKLKAKDYLKSAVGWVYGCVNVISNDVASIDLHLSKYEKGEQTEVDDHAAIDVIYAPNNAMSRFDFIDLTFQSLELTGEAPWYVSFKGGKPNGLLLLRPDRLTVKPGKDGEMIGGYKYSLYGDTGTKEIDLEPYEVIPLKYTDPNNQIRGKGPLQAAATTFDLDAYSEKWNSQFFKNSASPSAAFQTDKVLAKDIRKRLETRIKENYQGIENAHKTLILENGLKYQQISLSQKDMDFIEQQKFSRDKLLAIFRTPPTVLGLTADVTRANAEATDYVFAKRTIKPKMKRFVEQLNTFYLPLFGNTQNLFFTFDDPVPENVDQLVSRANTGVSTGYLTINEARALFGYDPVDGGDDFRSPQDFTPVASFDGKSMKSVQKKTVKATRYMKQFYNQRKREPESKNLQKKIISKVIEESVMPMVIKNLRLQEKREKALQVCPFTKGTPEEIKESKWAFQEKQLNVASKYEERFIAKMNSVFEVQKDAILRGLDGNHKMTLKVDVEQERYLKALKPVMIEMMREQSDLAFQILGIQRNFTDDKAELTFLQRLSQYFEVRTFRFAGQVTKETNKKIGALFAEATKAGESIAEIKKRVVTLFGDMESYRSERIARTETIRGSNFAVEETYKESGVVEAKEWLATRDERTDEECAQLDGKIIPLGKDFQTKHQNGYEAVPFPPIHVNCRCTLIPVIQR